MLIDTNIAIYYLANKPKAVSFLSEHYEHLYLSFISKIELLSYPYQQSDTELLLIKQFIDDFRLIMVNDDIIQQTAKIRQQKKIKTPDAIIVATAMVMGMPLATHNTKDFKGLSVELIDPMI